MQNIDIASLLDLMPLNIYWKDKHGVYLGCNLAQAHFFGFQSADEVIGKTDLELVKEKDLAKAWMKNDQIIMRSGTSLVTEETGIFNNQKITALSCKTPFKDELGAIAGIIGVSIDITAQKKLAEKLMQEKNIAQITLENVIARLPGHVYWMNKENQYLGCNELHAQSAGLKNRQEIIGKTNYQLPWSDHAKSLNDINNNVMASKKEMMAEEHGVLADGTTKTFLSRKAPLLDNNDSVIGLLGVALDITDRKQMEEELIKSKNIAESANRAKTEFLANMSHDMKTPLAGIVTTAEVIIGDQNISERGRKYGEIIAGSGKQLAEFLTSCLDLSKLEMQEWASNTVVFSIRQLLQDIHALYLPKAMSNQLLLHIEYDEALPKKVEGHRDSLYRVLLNLVGNAIKFTEQGSVTLRATLLKPMDDQQIIVEFQIQDTGIGIPDDKHKIIFEKLRRLKPSYESQVEGSGIGLYIVDQYVQRMGGEIKVESQLGQGSTFTVTLPLKMAFGKVVTSTVATQSNHAIISPEPARIKTSHDVAPIIIAENQHLNHLPQVLLVEDNEMIQFVTKSLLNSAGFSVDIASTGEEAVEKFEPYKYGLIYMDIGLPKMTGYEAATAIRQKEKQLNATSETAIIALTGHGATDIQAFCGAAGMQGVLSKPLSREQAELLWKHFSEDTSISVPGLTLLTDSLPEPSMQEILDVDATIKMVGTKDIALNLIGTLVNDLESQFLPQVKMLILEHKNEELRFVLHRQLGALAYAKAPRLEKKLSEIQSMIQKGANINEAVYQGAEREVQRVIQYYKKMDLEQLAKAN